jgi:hypothetical protein
MSKKDFIALADSIKAHNKWAGLDDISPFRKQHIDVLADFCQSQNPRFKRDRWLAYIAGECGPNGGSVKKGKVRA